MCVGVRGVRGDVSNFFSVEVSIIQMNPFVILGNIFTSPVFCIQIPVKNNVDPDQPLLLSTP